MCNFQNMQPNENFENQWNIVKQISANIEYNNLK